MSLRSLCASFYLSRFSRYRREKRLRAGRVQRRKCKGRPRHGGASPDSLSLRNDQVPALVSFFDTSARFSTWLYTSTQADLVWCSLESWTGSICRGFVSPFLVWKVTSFGILLAFRFCSSCVHSLGRYSCMSTGRCAFFVQRVKETATWHGVTFPALPVYCRLTPTECFPYFKKPVSSMMLTSASACFLRGASA